MTKIVIIGSSGHTGYVIKGLPLLENAEIVGLAPGTQGESMDSLAADLSAIGMKAEIYDDYRRMLDASTPDFAVINSYFCYQSAIAAEVLDKNIHAFVEKPVACSMRDLENLEKVYHSSTAEMVSMLGLRYDPAFYTAWKSAQDGSIGEVRMLHAQKSYRLGNRDHYYRDRALYGGTIPWVGIHAIDWLQWFAGPEFITVDARHSTLSNGGHGDLEASAVCLFGMKNGVFATVNVDYLRPDTADSHGDDRIRAVGSKGIIEVRGGKALLINGSASGTQSLTLESPGNIFAGFVKSTRGTESCLIDAADSFRATRLVLLARESADQESTINIADYSANSRQRSR